MPANQDFENEEIENQRSAELAKSKAESRRANQKDNIAESESRTPQTQEAELLPQEYGRPIEDEEEKETDKRDEESGGEEGENEPEGIEGEEESDNESLRALELTESQMRQLKAQRAITAETKEATKKLKKNEKELKLSQLQDRTRNAVKIIRVIWGWAIVYWWLILLPIVFAAFVTIALGVVVWGCGINLGSYSMNTRRLQEKFKNEKKRINREKNEKIKKIQKSI